MMTPEPQPDLNAPMPFKSWDFYIPEDESFLQIRFVAPDGSLRAGSWWPLDSAKGKRGVAQVVLCALNEIESWPVNSDFERPTESQRERALQAMKAEYEAGRTLTELSFRWGMAISNISTNLRRLGTKMRRGGRASKFNLMLESNLRALDARQAPDVLPAH